MKRDKIRRALAARNAAQPDKLASVPVHEWPGNVPDGLSEVWRSKTLLVQIYAAEHGATRLSICRTTRTVGGGRWQDGLRWEEIQAVKAELGFSRHAAVEIYPPVEHEVNVANMRHIWILQEYPEFMWTKP